VLILPRVVRNSDAKVPFTVRIIESDEVNAFALPGGFLFVNTGLILAADQEAELAGVLAHETAHVPARHGAETASKKQAVNLASIPLIFLGGVAGAGARQAAGSAIPISFLKFTRSQEAEADYLGAQDMYKSGYDPSAMLSFFERLQAKEKARPGTMSSLLQTILLPLPVLPQSSTRSKQFCRAASNTSHRLRNSMRSKPS
jgi:predicted Zn-dependent protease